MKPIPPPPFPIKDTWFRCLAVILPLLLIAYVNGFYTNPTLVKLGRIGISLGSTVLISEGSRLLIYSGQQLWQGKKRWIYLFLAGIVWTCLILCISLVLRRWIATGSFTSQFHIDTFLTLNETKLVVGLFGYGLLNALVTFQLLWVIYATFYHAAKLRYTEKEKERMESEKLKAELQQLKGIVNPHFLFNNLNSLSSLIAEDPGQAQDFLDELTRVFRYLLRNNDTELTPLSEELKFIRSYYQLLRTRYGPAINMDIQTSKSHEELMIPPMTLQLLVENAVKHNRLQKDAPLHIQLTATADNKLVITNNLLPRESGVESTGIGLQNIRTRYQMLGQPGISVDQTDQQFSVTISLIPLAGH